MPFPEDAACAGPARADNPIHVARLRDGVVILDVAKNNYAGLYLPTDALESRSTVVDVLRDQGFDESTLCHLSLVCADEGRRPWQDCLPDDRAPLRARDVLLFLAALLRASTRYHGRSFDALVAHAQQDPRPAADLARYATALARFDRLSRWLPFRMQCLFRANLFLQVLRSYGLPADWIFGVSLFPFHAHCWIAVGDHLLGDRAEKTEDFVPILSIINTMGART